MQHKNMEAALTAVFTRAIKTMGVANFKRTSLFGSNERAAEQRKAA